MYTEEFYMLLGGLSAESRFFMQIVERNDNSGAGNNIDVERIEVSNMREFRNAIGR